MKRHLANESDPHRELDIDGFKRAAKRLRRGSDTPHREALERVARACGFATFDEAAHPARVFRRPPGYEMFLDALRIEWKDQLSGWQSSELADLYDNIFRVVFVSPKQNYRQAQRDRFVRKHKLSSRAGRRTRAASVEPAVTQDAGLRGKSQP